MSQRVHHLHSRSLLVFFSHRLPLRNKNSNNLSLLFLAVYPPPRPAPGNKRSPDLLLNACAERSAGMDACIPAGPEDRASSQRHLSPFLSTAPAAPVTPRHRQGWATRGHQPWRRAGTKGGVLGRMRRAPALCKARALANVHRQSGKNWLVRCGPERWTYTELLLIK